MLTFFFRLHHCGKYRDFTLGSDLEGCDLVFCHGCFRNRDNDFTSQSVEIVIDIFGA